MSNHDGDSIDGVLTDSDESAIGRLLGGREPRDPPFSMVTS
jgi:hypothetical protein